MAAVSAQLAADLAPACRRRGLEAAGIGCVFAVPAGHRLTTSGGVRMRADQALGLVEAGGWNRRSCGMGAKGPRYYGWAWIASGGNRDGNDGGRQRPGAAADNQVLAPPA